MNLLILIIFYNAYLQRYFRHFSHLSFGLALQAVESDDQQRLRFQVELEFVQCLANPNYLHCKFKIKINQLI